MRIAVNTRMLLKNRLEGIGWYSYEILRRLALLYPQHTFYFLFDRQWDASFVFGPNVIPVRVSPPARHPILFYIWFELRLPAVLRKLKADVFFSPDGFTSLRTKVPTLLTIHDLAYLHFPDHVSKSQLWYYRRFVPKFLKRAEHITTVSETTRQDLLASFPVAPDKISVEYNGVHARFCPATEAESKVFRDEFTDGNPYFLYVGAIHPRKNVARLIRAFTRFKEERGTPHRLLLVGRMAWMSEDVQSAIDASPYKNEIVRAGYQAGNLPVCYSAATALVYVSLFEGFGIPLLEAMSCGTAVITSNLSSMPEVAGDAAILVDPTDIPGMADAMFTLASNPQTRDELIRKGYERSKAFSWEVSARKIGHHLENLLPAKTFPTTNR